EVGFVLARIVSPEAGMEIYDPCCGSAGLLVKCEIVLDEKTGAAGKKKSVPLRLHGQEYVAETWAMANMNMIIHDMEGHIELGDTFKNPKFHKGNRLQTFDRVVANPMWNQDWWKEADYDADEFDRFPKGAGYPGRLGLGADDPRQPQAAGTRRRGARYGRCLARLWQCEHEQGKGSTPLVCRARPDRRRYLSARKSFLQHHRPRHHPCARQSQAERAAGQTFSAQRHE